MDNITGKWSFNRAESDYWNNDLFDTKEKAEKTAVEYAKIIQSLHTKMEK